MKKQRLLICILMLLLAFMLLPGAAWAAVGDTFTIDNIEYRVTGVDPAEVEVSNGTKFSDENLVIPPTVENDSITYTVTAIGDNAFYNNQRFKTITFPNTLTKIGNRAFMYCYGLEGALTLPEGLKEIGDYAFSGYAEYAGFFNNKLINITSVTLLDSLEELGAGAFHACNITSVVVPDKIKQLNSETFSACFELSSVTLPDGLTAIGTDGQYAGGPFQHCKSLKTITLPDSVEFIGNTAFAQSGLTEITLPANCKTLWDAAFGYCDDLAKITWNDKLKTVNSNAFAKCNNLQEVTIPPGIASFDPAAFRNCTGTINVSDISLYAALINFRDNGPNQYDTAYTVNFVGSLQNLEFEDGNFKYIVIDEAKKYVQLMGIKDNVTPDAGLTLPGTATYADLNQEYTVTEIGVGVFGGHTELTSVELPANLIKIADRAFSGCTGLTSLTLPDTVEVIGNQAFYECINLTEVNFSSGLTEIGERAFYKCAIENLDLRVSTQLAKIGVRAFENCAAMTSAQLPDSLPAIGDEAFHACTALKEVNLPAALTDMGNSVFQNCHALSVVACPENMQLRELPKYTFAGCVKLGQINLPASIKKIGRQAFSNCQNLQGFTLPESVEELAEYAFYQCPGLCGGVWKLPAGITTIGKNAFDECDIERLIIKQVNSLQTLEKDAFAGVAQLVCFDKATLEKLQSVAGEGTQVWLLYDIANVKTAPDFVDNQVYTGAEIRPEITLYVEENGERIVFAQGADYTVTYENNVNITENVEKPAEIHFLPVDDGRLYGEVLIRPFIILKPEAPKITISFVAGEGDGEMEPVSLEAGSACLLPECAFSAPEGKEFAGWDWDGTIYQPGYEIIINSDIVLEAVWKDKTDEPEPPVVKEYWTITFALNGGALTPADNPVRVEKGRPYTLPNAAKEGYKLQHWQIGEAVPNIVAAANSAYTFTADTTVYAVWQEEPKPDEPKPDEPKPEEPEKPSGGSSGGSHRPSRPQQPAEPAKPTEPAKPGEPSQPANPQPAVSDIFPDLQPGAWYIDAISWLYHEGIMQGNADGTFAPNDNISRAMFAQLLYNSSGRPVGYSSRFADVAAGSWYAPAIGWAQENGVVLGYTAERFAPNEGITREQLVVMLWRFAGQPQVEQPAQFTDAAQVGDWARAALCWAAAEGIVIGDENGAFKPQNMATRAEAAQMLVRYLAK